MDHSPEQTRRTAEQTVVTVSDLHLFCRRSHAKDIEGEIHAAAAESDQFVLNGDIFDFRWSIYPDHAETVRRSLDWLADITAAHPHNQFHYVLGNHDSVRPFVDALEPFADSVSNLNWDPWFVRLGDAVFLHGDVAHRPMSAEELAVQRARCEHHRRRGELWNRVWDAGFRAGVHRAVVRYASPPGKVVSRVSHYLADVGLGRESGVRRVYFGHTHRPLDGYRHDGLAYYNTGSPLRGLDFSIVRAQVEI